MSGIGTNVGENVGENTGSSGEPSIPPVIGGQTALFVDQTLLSDITNGTYSIANRDGSGSDGNAYNTLTKAIVAMDVGNDVILRGGTYTGPFPLPLTKNGTSWDAGNYINFTSLNTTNGGSSNEWAVLDGNFACGSISTAEGGAVIGYGVQSTTGSVLEYYKFERIEIKNGRSTDGSAGFGFHGNGGPFWFRHCYIQNNRSAPGTCGNLPSGVWGYNWKDCIVEYCWFENNGCDGNNNGKQIGWVAQYPQLTSQTEIADTGFTTDKACGYDKDNEIRYNLVEGGHGGIYVKHFSMFTSRTTLNPYNDTFADYGSKIHHNIITGGTGYAIGAHGDFYQVHHNIIENPNDSGILIGYGHVGYWRLYKVCVYNNTIVNPGRYGVIGWFYGVSGYLEDDWKYTYNNIVDNSDVSNQWCTEAPITPQLFCSGRSEPMNSADHHTSHNYSYRPLSADQYKIDTTTYTPTEWEAQSITTAPKVAYENNFQGSNRLYVSESGNNAYVTDESHVIEGSTTVANGGIGGAHPYLASVTLPSYIGATDPSDNGWVPVVNDYNVLDVSVPVNLRNAVIP